MGCGPAPICAALALHDLERWPSGRRRLLGKQVNGNPVSRVRIPPSPPVTKKAPSWGLFNYQWEEWVRTQFDSGPADGSPGDPDDGERTAAGRPAGVSERSERINPALSASN